MPELQELLREQRVIINALQASMRRSRRIANEASHVSKGPVLKRLLLLEMTESLIRAHKAAKIDDDGYTLDLIEDAMLHVGERLSTECLDGRTFSRKKLRPL